VVATCFREGRLGKSGTGDRDNLVYIEVLVFAYEVVNPRNVLRILVAPAFRSDLDWALLE
jgi:hypothetical protein